MTERLDTPALIARSQAGDGAATAQLVEENSGLIWSVARRFFGRGTEPDDLYQLGCVGFLKAVAGFDVAFGTQFSTYAVPKISGEIRRFLRDDGPVKVSRGLKEQAARIRAVRSALEQRLGREPYLSEIAAETGFSPEDIAYDSRINSRLFAETAAGPTESLQRESEEGFTLEHVLGDYGAEERLLERFALDEAISALGEREQKLIALRFFHGLTQDKTARILGISQVQVSRLERKALALLREKLGAGEA